MLSLLVSAVKLALHGVAWVGGLALAGLTFRKNPLPSAVAVAGLVLLLAGAPVEAWFPSLVYPNVGYDLYPVIRLLHALIGLVPTFGALLVIVAVALPSRRS
jgi:hypothetical protein